VRRGTLLRELRRQRPLLHNDGASLERSGGRRPALRVVPTALERRAFGRGRSIRATTTNSDKFTAGTRIS